jgi:UDP-N-acetyl-D-mannosaminuronic acid transferase (WecB/TagA/CpsF family)
MTVEKDHSAQYRQILGVRFFTGSSVETIDRLRPGGLLVVPAAPALCNLATHAGYREALMGSDIAITDSMFMVLIWNLITGDRISRLSGLHYLKDLLKDSEVRSQGSTLWIMASEKSSEKNLHWLRTHGIDVEDEDIYIAPMYSAEIADEALLAKMKAHRYRHVIITLGGGTQERLGLYLKRNAEYLPAIHCIGAAIAFLSGDQVHIPGFVDTIGMAWFFRCLSKPMVYVPRYWAARKLAFMLLRYRHVMPPLQAE